MPPDWRADPVRPATVLAGAQWLLAREHAVLRLSSALVPLEDNYVLNPEHPDFSQITIVGTTPFAFDTRLLV